MEWNTIPKELLSGILVFTASAKAVTSACRACKSWSEIDADSQLWKGLYHEIVGAQNGCETIVDWKQRVIDLCQIRKNVRGGRCVVRTIATSHAVGRRDNLEFDNYSMHKDYFLCNWLALSRYGSNGSVVRSDSHLINMVTEEKIQSNCQNILFLNGFLAHSPSSHFGGAELETVLTRSFDPKNIAEHGLAVNEENSVKAKFPASRKLLLKNYCAESVFVGFMDSAFSRRTPRPIYVVNAQSGELVCKMDGSRGAAMDCQMYDQFVVLMSDERTLEVTDVVTGQLLTRRVFKDPLKMGFMTSSTIALHSTANIIVWNFVDATQKVYPTGAIPHVAIEMMYNDMWVTNQSGKLYFYDMQDGSLVNALRMKQNNGPHSISVVSDGRLVIIQRNSCRVVSFMDSDVNRAIKVELLDGKEVTTCTMVAHELGKFFVEKVQKPLEFMTSRIVPYSTVPQTDERFVLVFSIDEKSGKDPVNETATSLFKKAEKPEQVNVPYQEWKFDTGSKPFMPAYLPREDVNRVCGNAIIVREKFIEGRWQMVSI